MAMRTARQMFTVMFGVMLPGRPAPPRAGIFHGTTVVMLPQGFAVRFPMLCTRAAFVVMPAVALKVMGMRPAHQRTESLLLLVEFEELAALQVEIPAVQGEN